MIALYLDHLLSQQLIVLPVNRVMVGGVPAANIMDYKPFVNIPTFGVCNSILNPATKRPPPVIFTPAPCVPNIVAPWAPGSPTVLIANMPALNNMSKAMCMWGGVIQVVTPGQFQTMVP
jgi:hypothetical protein